MFSVALAGRPCLMTTWPSLLDKVKRNDSPDHDSVWRTTFIIGIEVYCAAPASRAYLCGECVSTIASTSPFFDVRVERPQAVCR